MPKATVTLPSAAMDHMSNTAKERLSKVAPHVITTPEPPPPEPIFHYNTTAADISNGIDGVVDRYIFDMAFLDLLCPQDRINYFGLSAAEYRSPS